MHELIVASIGVIGGILLVIGSFTKNVSAARWSKIALFLAGVTVLCWGGLIFIKINYAPMLTVRSMRLVEHYKTLVSGTGLGILLTLFISGELSLKRWRKIKA